MAQSGGIQALLLGGRADGRAVRLHELHRELLVFANGTLRVENGDGVHDALLPGVTRYKLVEPVGPEMAVYVQS